ncbi:beta-N-acetylglucosaminidase domain-containing protein [Neobacillus kokaensis]|uniref:Beta-N-acetylhexosaminidase n=1 Tax=Neobacillus kokaensis TaxID=2759023 RepID=A0ABQ3N548_9BACI|nr:beta-N-acetylglucosaminidase domain-containing protein [Neobacillus kokaensis]GHI00059.1 hypothetical protein AM1BK_36010 [Neobacillus kokaensis]
MLKKLIITLIVSLLSLSNFSVWASNAAAATDTQAEANGSKYEVYPLPQSETYDGNKFSITNEVNVVIEKTIDGPTVNFLNQILESKSLEISHSEEVVSNKTNIIIGTKNSKGYVDSYFNENVEYDGTIFNKQDAYVLTIDEKLEGKGTIAILGKDTDAAYYALATLQMIFEQIPEKKIQSVKYEDYSDAKWRGFIEGFYGIPWSHEDRISLMRFGGKLKMNSYIFGPKDDKYHNYEWRKPYPADELAKIKELVDVGHESKTQFVWSIHPGMNTIKWAEYDKELDTLLAKLEQLYNVGVRQFGLFMDDISLDQSLKDTDKHVKLVTDVATWVKEKGDIKSLIYCPPYYNQAWTGEKGKPYLRAFQNVPENVEIMWTGNDVIGSVNTTDMQWVKDLIGRDSYVWLNWPVNGYKKNRLLLGKLDILKPGTHNISGVVSNPLEFAELSKVALFGVADYTWNIDEFNVEKSWQESFKYVAPEVADELKTIAYHMSDPSPNGRNVVAGESENIKAELELFMKQFSNNESTEEVGNQLIAEFSNVLHAIEEFRNKSNNKAMVEEIEPWLNCLKYVVESGKHAITSAMALQKGSKNEAWEELAKATTAMSESKKFSRKLLEGTDLTVEAGTKRLVPFAQQLMNKLDALIYTSINPEAVIPSAISSYKAYPDLNKFVDGDPNTYVYIKDKQVNDDWYGVDLGKSVKINDIQILQGRNDSDYDIFHKGMLEYSQDGENWTSIGEERTGFKVTAKDLDIEARYVRYRLTHAGIPGGKPDLWTAVREFTVNGNKGKAGIYTNVTKLKETNVNAIENSVEIANLTNITLKPSEYVGIKLSTIENVAEIVLESKNADLILESSENGVEWKEVNLGGPYQPAAYLRLMNQKNEEVTFDLTKLAIIINKFTEPKISHNYNKVYQGKVDNVFDGNLETRVWFDGRQDMGRYVQVDMGGIVDIQNVAVVINDGEKDYFKKGDLQLSIDGKSWETVHSFNNPESRELNFPEFEAPYRYKRVQIEGGKQARYVRLYTTETKSGWLALNEILVNEGVERPGVGNNNPALKSDPYGDIGNEAIYSIDQKLSTFFTPLGDPKPGYFSYKISEQTKLSEIIILQSPTGISNADVSVRDLNGWHKLGNLSQSLNTINTSNFEHVLEVKLQWDGNVKPKIYEIIPVKRDVVTINQLDEELQMAYEQGWIKNEGVLNSLLVKVEDIQENQNNKKKAYNGLNSLENQVRDLSGEKIDESYARVLLGIIAQLKKGLYLN